MRCLIYLVNHVTFMTNYDTKKEIEEDKNKQKHTLYLWIERIKMIEMSILPSWPLWLFVGAVSCKLKFHGLQF